MDKKCATFAPIRLARIAELEYGWFMSIQPAFSPPPEPIGLEDAPTYNLEAEQALLGVILFDNECYNRIAGFLRAEHLYDPVHQRIFETAAHLIEEGRLADPRTMKPFAERDEGLTQIGGIEYLATLMADAPSAANAIDYARAIFDAYMRRGLIRVGEEMAARARDAQVDDPPGLQVEQAEQHLYGLAETGKYGGGFKTFSTSLKVAIEHANAAYERDGGLSGMSSGLNDLDNRLGGLHPSDLIILAGRPSMGKSSLAVNIAYNVARAYRTEKADDGTTKVADGGVVGLFSLEMSADQLATRVLSEQARVSSEKIRRGEISESEYERIFDVSRELERLPLHIDDTGGISIAALAARARRLKREKGLGLIVVDYLQLVTSSSRRGSENRVQEVSEVTQGLKALAKELNVPVIALAQLSRQVEARDDKRPQLADLRESGSIEQDADVVMFVYREEYYLKRTEPNEGTAEHLEWQNKMDAVHGLAEVIIGKQRHGPIGIVRLQFEERLTRFSDLADPERYASDPF